MANHLMLLEHRKTLIVVYGVKKESEAFRVVMDHFNEEPLSFGSYGCSPESLAALRAEIDYEVEEHGYTIFSMNWEGLVRTGLHTAD